MVKSGATSSGFTLVELLVTMVVFGILASIAIPSFSDLIKNSRLATETNDLMSDLAYARSEAARQGKRVTLCVSSNGTSCGTGSAWTAGRIIFVDTGTYGTVDGTDTVLRVTNSVSTKKITITTSGFTTDGSSTLNYLQFKQSGATSSGTNGKFMICDDRTGAHGREIELLITGRAALKTTSASCP